MSQDSTTLFCYASGAFGLDPHPLTLGPVVDAATTDKQPFILFNVATAPTDRVYTYENVTLQAAQQLVGEILYEKGPAQYLQTFELKSLDSYTDGLVDVAKALSQFGPDCVLVPMRGGVKPCEYLDTMLNRKIRFERFAYTHNSDPDLFRTYEGNIALIVERYAKANPNLRLAVVDAGIGGNGSNRLAMLLARLQRHLGGVWQVQFHILYPEAYSVQPFEAVARKSKPGQIDFSMHPHPVHHLWLEDWDPGLGLISERKGDSMTYKPSIVPGAIFVRGSDGRGHLAVSRDTRRAVNKTFSHMGSRRMHEKFRRYPEYDHRGEFAKFFRQQR